MDFKDQIIVITGASNGIGKQLALDLAARRAVIIGCGRSIPRLKETLKQVRELSPNSLMIGCDVSDREQVHGMSEKILAEFGRVDVLINNAGIGMRRPFVETSLDLIEEILRVNYLGAVYCTHELLPSMIARHCGHIVNISSGAGKIGTLNMAAYCGSKFAMNGWSESLYYELQPLGVKVSVLCPGPVATEFGRDFKDTEPKSPASLLAAASAVSRDVIALIESARFERITPRWLAFLSWVRGTAPGIFRRLARRRFTPYVVSAAPNRAPQTGNKSEF